MLVLDVRGLPKVIDLFQKIKKLAPEKFEEVTNDCLIHVRDEIVKRLGRRPYPLIDTGRLRASITFVPAVKLLVTWTGKVFTELVYAAIHEFGGFAGPGRRVYIPPRPYFYKTLEDEMGWITNRLEKILEEISKIR